MTCTPAHRVRFPAQVLLSVHIGPVLRCTCDLATVTCTRISTNAVALYADQPPHSHGPHRAPSRLRLRSQQVRNMELCACRYCCEDMLMSDPGPNRLMSRMVRPRSLCATRQAYRAPCVRQGLTW
jgi:hypothetical protein